MKKRGEDKLERTANTGQEAPETAADGGCEERAAANMDGRVGELTELLRASEEQAASYLDKLQRTTAEYENFRRRNLKEKEERFDEGVRDTVLRLLPVIDNFERALTSVDGRNDEFYKGVAMIHQQLTGTLIDIGVAPIETVGTAFDTNLHAAVAHVEDEAYGDGEVISELQKGYIYKDRVIRHSMVNVAN